MTRVAAIDCGTNSIRLLIADIDNGEFKEIVRSMEVVRLGQGVDKNKLFQPDAIDRTLAAVDNFNEEIVSKSVEKIRFCATSATRDATNRSLFTDGVKNILGVEVEVILGDEEAKLSYFGATKGLKQSDAPFLVVDIGGGSTEFVYGHEKVEFAKSVDIGCVRMSERHLNTQPVTMDQVARAIVDIDKAIAQAAAIVPISAAKTLIAVAGTATTVAAAALELKEYDRNLIHLSRISADKVYEVSAMLQS
ncbi:MAG: exopolyphosphatase, partial [Actinobacteria bacterium]|nr:exopolyphosphatase [Actinomycetota bacterium]NDD78548.1 exopolyphosphatase [Actinomycetota bacterium]